MNYADVLNRRYADRAWSAVGDDYEGIDWLDESKKPTKAELEALFSIVDYEIKLEQVEALRRAAYQTETDGLFFAAQSSGGSLDEWRAARDAIKQRYPDPTP